MAETGWHLPDVITEEVYGEFEWLNEGRLTAKDGSYASCTPGNFGYSKYIKARDFDFTPAQIPEGSTITGIAVRYKRYASSSAFDDNILKLRDNTGRIGDSMADYDWPTSPTEDIIGGAGEMWGTSLTDAKIRATTFGVDLVCRCNGASATAYIDSVEIKVYYTPPVPVPTTLVLFPMLYASYVGKEYVLTAKVYDGESELMAGVGVTWSIVSGVGEYKSYDSETDESGEAKAIYTSDEVGEAVVKCEVDDYPAVYDTAASVWYEYPARSSFFKMF